MQENKSNVDEAIAMPPPYHRATSQIKNLFVILNNNLQITYIDLQWYKCDFTKSEKLFYLRHKNDKEREYYRVIRNYCASYEGYNRINSSKSRALFNGNEL